MSAEKIRTLTESVYEKFGPDWQTLYQDAYRFGRHQKEEMVATGTYQPERFLCLEDLDNDPFALAKQMVFVTWNEIKYYYSMRKLKLHKMEAMTLLRRYVPYPELWLDTIENDSDWLDAKRNPDLAYLVPSMSIDKLPQMPAIEELFKDTPLPMTPEEMANCETEPKLPMKMDIKIHCPFGGQGAKLIMSRQEYNIDSKGLTTVISDLLKYEEYDEQTYFDILLRIFDHLYHFFHREKTADDRDKLEGFAKWLQGVFIKRWDQHDTSLRMNKIGRTSIALGLLWAILSEKLYQEKGLVKKPA